MADVALPQGRVELAALRPARLILTLAGAILSLMTIVPLLWMVSMSLKTTDEVFAPNLIPHRADTRQLPLRLHPTRFLPLSPQHASSSR